MYFLLSRNGKLLVSDYVLELTDLVAKGETVITLPMKFALHFLGIANVLFWVLTSFEKQDILRQSTYQNIFVINHLPKTIAYHLLYLRWFLISLRTILLFFPIVHRNIFMHIMDLLHHEVYFLIHVLLLILFVVVHVGNASYCHALPMSINAINFIFEVIVVVADWKVWG